MTVNEGNGERPCADDCAACASERWLRVLADRLGNRGLEAEMIACGVPEDGRHFDAVTVMNPAAPQRGVFHVDDDGSAAWEFPGSGLDDDGIGRLVDEAVNALRARGMRLPRRQAKES